ncbi:MAG: hypothetical protein HC898_04405 [Phycisphaerales bacterium]|nr:hypothetical protein [Phycisphaerales bacterium]
MLAIFGRGTMKQPTKVVRELVPDFRAYQIREVLFARSMRPEFFTGHFFMEPGRQGWLIKLQLTPGISKSSVPKGMMRGMVRSINLAWGQTVTVEPIVYQDYQPGMELNHLRKFRHI